MRRLVVLLLLLAGPGWADPPSVINLGPDFKGFMQASRGLDFEDQERLWKNFVETNHQIFYDKVVWGKGQRSDWEARRRQRLAQAFAYYARDYPRIQAEFDRFEATLNAEVERFRNYFADFSCDVPVYAAPVAGAFNGKSAETGIPILAFGIDVIAQNGDEPGVLYSHELFHVYHAKAIGLNQTLMETLAHLTTPLWLEGLATYFSRQANPEAPWAQVLMDPRLERLSETQVVWLAREFLKVADEPAGNQELYANWFMAGDHTVREGFPPRCGYLLGCLVAQHLAKTHSLDEMAHWTMEEYPAQVIPVLTAMARPKSPLGWTGDLTPVRP